MGEAGSLQRVTVGVTAGRRGAEFVRALEDLGANVVWGPSVSLVPVPAERLQEETAAALASRPAWALVTTGDGLDRWVAGAGPLRRELLDALGRTPLAARGYKAERACAHHGLVPALTARSERGRELVAALASHAPEGSRVTVQLDGDASPALVASLEGAGLGVQPVRPYRWAPPADLAPARELVTRAVGGALDLICFTSPPAVRGLFEVAADLGVVDSLRGALAGDVEVAVIGPATAEAVEANGGTVDVCPSNGRIDALLTALAGSRPLGRQPLPLRLDVRRLSASLGTASVALTDLEFSLLAALGRRHQQTCTTQLLLREVWGEPVDRRRLEALVSRLRQRLGVLDLQIASVPKRGYRLERSVTPPPPPAPAGEVGAVGAGRAGGAGADQ